MNTSHTSCCNLQELAVASHGEAVSSAGMGLGTTELSPEMMEKMARLERENKVQPCA